MAKNNFPGLKTSGGTLSKVIGTAVLIAAIVLVVKYPGDAAAGVHNAFAFGGDAIDGIVNFFRDVGGR